VALKAIRQLPAAVTRRLIVIGNRRVAERAASRLRLRLPSLIKDAAFVDCEHRTNFPPGRSSPQAGRASLEYLDHAIALWKQGKINAMVTAPVTKWAIEQVQRGFIGQTEYLARRQQARHVVMMFVSNRWRVALLTRHLPLRQVPRAVDRRAMTQTLTTVHRALSQLFGLRHPRVAVLGLNPHAGEAGLFGQEERAILLPVLRRLKRQGIACEGPFAADGFFAAPARHDAVVCWYHDQGLIPFKMASRDRGCQLSVGLPLIRTSPDHGSALDIAGRGIADPGSMGYAIRLAARLADRSLDSPRLRRGSLGMSPSGDSGRHAR
jgi:4-hydroxythreonine-4-phosphate dehydrogenase